MKHLLRALALVLVSSLSWAAPSTAADEPTCNGKPATIVSSAENPDPVGTDGDDVVVLEGPAGHVHPRFQGGAGDDTICDDDSGIYIDAGAGDDWVDAGGGSDRITGGPGADSLEGGAGSDVLAGDLDGDPAGAWPDSLSGGVGDDGLVFDAEGTAGTADSGDGGPGSDIASWGGSRTGTHIDAATATADGVVATGLTGIERWAGSEHDDTIIGTDGDDILYGGEDVGGSSDVIRARAGDDVVSATGGKVDAGPGDDLFTSPDQDAVALGLEIDLGPGRDTALMSWLTATTILGGPGKDTFEHTTPPRTVHATPLSVTVYGGPGDDVLTFENYRLGLGDTPGWMVDLDTRTHRAEAWGTIRFHSITDFRGSRFGDRFRGAADRDDRFWGLGGDDFLTGLAGNDVLIGGPRQDRADGGAGRDICSAERSTGCERR